jgi:hypothetical protein
MVHQINSTIVKYTVHYFVDTFISNFQKHKYDIIDTYEIN